MKSKLCGNKLSTLKQLKALISTLNISSLDRYFFWAFFKVRSEGNDTGQARAQKEREDTAGDARPLSNPVKVNRWGWESKRRRKGREGEWVQLIGLFKVRRRRSLVFSLSVLSWACTGSFFRLLLFLYLPPFPAQPSRKLNQRLLCAEWKIKCLGRKKKKGGPQKTKRCWAQIWQHPGNL